jgi:hypothetical protein
MVSGLVRHWARLAGPAEAPQDLRRYGRVVPNADQIEYWDGPAGEHWVAEQDRYDRINISGGCPERC